MYMARYPEQQHKLSTIVTLGSQSTKCAQTVMQKIRIVTMVVSVKIFGKIYGKAVGFGEENESPGFIHQWSRWNWTEKWLGKDNFDYLASFNKLEIPTLCIAGGGDVIAPLEGCKQLFESLNGNNNKFLLCSQANGFAEDYSHPRLIASQNSRKEIWPQILDFIQ